MGYAKIAFYRAGLIGDNVVALHAIYVLRFLYPDSLLVVYTNSNGIQLYTQFTFIDVLINIDSLGQKELQNNINSYSFDVFVLTQANRRHCNLIYHTNCKKIISFLSAGNIFKSRFHTIFLSRNFNSMPQYQRMLMLVRKIDSQIFDKHINAIDFSAIMLRSNQENDDFVQNFFNTHNICLESPIVVINPFVHSTFCNLTLHECGEGGWNKLINILSSLYPTINFIIPTYSNNKKLPDSLPQNVKIFYNTHDLLNLVALLRYATLLISPSTGPSHIANNLKIPIILLCSKRDKSLWKGDNMDSSYFIELQKTTKHITPREEDIIIQETLEKFKIFCKNYNVL
ncbi:glycosyltransferase family 9 protein [Helicobacter didelphidarum]|uniref:glycosyltransferase family 9 protein n=1 Tax=Helicobacter didelphidarum TaxID=2040648 RepID=UPI001FE5A210|nr:hypothetical protein [Helicobacter didelphidarum]